MRNPKTRKKYNVEFAVVDDNYTPLIGFQSGTQSPLHIWKMSDFVDWPQTSGVELQEASRLSSKAPSEISAATPAV
jgi:RNase P/RNase MRP subunit p30